MTRPPISVTTLSVPINFCFRFFLSFLLFSSFDPHLFLFFLFFLVAFVSRVEIAFGYRGVEIALERNYIVFCTFLALRTGIVSRGRKERELARSFYSCRLEARFFVERFIVRIRWDSMKYFIKVSFIFYHKKYL